MTINRPEARNALNKAVRDGIREKAQAFADDPSAQVLVIAAAGDKAFSAGGDLKEMADVQMRIPPRDLFVYFNRSLATDKPIIAAVNGIAYAGGFLLAQMCDLVICADHATFAITEAKVGRGAPRAAPLGLDDRSARRDGVADHRPTDVGAACVRGRLRQQGRSGREPAR